MTPFPWPAGCSGLAFGDCGVEAGHSPAAVKLDKTRFFRFALDRAFKR